MADAVDFQLGLLSSAATLGPTLSLGGGIFGTRSGVVEVPALSGERSEAAAETAAFTYCRAFHCAGWKEKDRLAQHSPRWDHSLLGRVHVLPTSGSVPFHRCLALPLLGRFRFQGLAQTPACPVAEVGPLNLAVHLRWLRPLLCRDRRRPRRDVVVARPNPLGQLSPRRHQPLFCPVWTFSPITGN